MTTDTASTSQLSLHESNLSSGRMRACKRCQARKRRCDRVLPQCGNCVAANVTCEPESLISERGAEQEIKRLQERINWLEGMIRAAGPAYEAITACPTGTSLRPLRDAQRSGHEGLVLPAWNGHSHIPSSLLGAIARIRQGKDANGDLSDDPASLGLWATSQETSPICWDDFSSTMSDLANSNSVGTGPQPSGLLPPIDVTREVMRRYNQDYKMLSQVACPAQLERDVIRVYSWYGSSNPTLASSRYRVYIILYLGWLLHYVAGEPATWTVYRELAMLELPQVCAQQNLTCVQALILLATIHVYDDHLNTSLVVALAARTALSIDLHCTDDVFFAGALDQPRLTDGIKDQRKRIFWSLYVLDRLVQSSFGIPPCLRDDEITVEVPVATCSELGWTKILTDQFHHAIIGRRLAGQIQSLVHGSTVQPSVLGDDIIAHCAERLKSWDESNPLRTPLFPLSDASVKRQALNDLDYLEMKISLYRPSRLMPSPPSSHIPILLDSAHKTLDLFAHYSETEKVNLNWPYLYHIFTVSIIMLYCYVEKHSRADMDESDPEEVEHRLQQSQRIMRTFRSCRQTSELENFLGQMITSTKRQLATPNQPTSVSFDVAAASPSRYFTDYLFDNAQWATSMQVGLPSASAGGNPVQTQLVDDQAQASSS